MLSVVLFVVRRNHRAAVVVCVSLRCHTVVVVSVLLLRYFVHLLTMCAPRISKAALNMVLHTLKISLYGAW
jgi:hypothetical protein